MFAFRSDRDVVECGVLFLAFLGLAVLMTEGAYWVAHRIAPTPGSEQVDEVIAAATGMLYLWWQFEHSARLSRDASVPWSLFAAMGLEAGVFAWWAFVNLAAEPKTALWFGLSGLVVSLAIYLWRAQEPALG